MIYEKTTDNTVSIGVEVNNDTIMKAKTYLKDKFGNKYDLNPHLNFVIMAMPEYRLKDLEATLDTYFQNKKITKLTLGGLSYEPKTKFFSIPIIGEEAMNLHKELLDILNPIRDSHIRSKDLVRINEGKTDAQEEEYIFKYGYLRVLNKFTPHIIVGNIETNEENFDVQETTNHLNEILKDLYNSTIDITKLYSSFIVDGSIQSEYKWLWEKEYTLS